MTTGERIKNARKKAGLTQKALGEKLGISYQTVAQWENNLRNPKYETLLRIATALGIDVDTLYTDREKEISTWSDVEGWCRAINYYGLSTPENTYAKKVAEIITTLRKYGYTLSENEHKVINVFNKLNSDGQQKAVERVEELTEIPRYQKSPETPPEAPPAEKGETTPEDG